MMSSIIIVVCFVFTVNGVHGGDEIDMDGIVDSVLAGVSEGLKESGTESIPIVDLEKRFKAGFIRGGVKATQGTFGDLSTVKRVGNTILDVSDDGNSAVFTGSVRLDTMEVNFGHTRAWVGALSVSDRLYVKVNKNSVNFKISAQVGDSCEVRLEEVNITEFGDLRVDLRSLHKIKFVAENIVSWIVNMFDKNIKSLVEYNLRKIIDKELNNHTKDICNILM